jgi:hypothetical protein
MIGAGISSPNVGWPASAPLPNDGDEPSVFVPLGVTGTCGVGPFGVGMGIGAVG